MKVGNRARRLFGVVAGLTLSGVVTAPAQVPPAVKFLIGGLNAQLPQKLDDHTALTRIAAHGDAVDVELTVEPGSPLDNGFDVRREASRLCGIEVFRTLTTAMSAQLRVTYIRPDKTSVGSFVIDRSICRS